MSYKETLFLPSTEMPINANLSLNEQKIYESWDKFAYQKMRRDGVNPFIIHDGPPYANGNIHIGHALNKILKDFTVKFHYFNGRAVEYVPGWDCHGLPIEQKVKSTSQGNFLEECRKYAKTQIDLQMKQFKSLGVLADWENHYETMDSSFEKMISDSLKELSDKGLLFQRKKPVFWSWHFKTALAEAEVEYKYKTDQSLYLVFKSDIGNVLVWTTTPWTLPANVAVAVNPNLKYCLVSSKHHPEPFLIAEDCFDELKRKEIVESKLIEDPTWNHERLTYEDLKNLKLKHPIYEDQFVPIVSADFVTSEKGTGFVHIAPGHGDEDFQVALDNNLPIVVPVGPDGVFTEGKYKGSWIFQKGSFDSNSLIIEDLKKSENFVCLESYTHSYPYCSRSSTPLIFRATNQWFLDLDKIRNLENNPLSCLDKVSFYPENSKNRLLPMVNSRPDWCISRQRLWGVPIFDSQNILDVWFDSGLSWRTLNGRQADVYFEGNDQHRGWFQSSLWLSSALVGQAPYKKVITHGFVIDGNKEKMSKSKGNVISPSDIVSKNGAEVLRYWVASSDYTKDLQISNEIIKRASEGYKKLRNTLRYLVANMPKEKLEFSGNYLPVDIWILDKSRKVFSEVNSLFSNQLYHSGIQKLSEYVNSDLSGIYMSSIKDRVYCDSDDRRNSAISAMSKILHSILGLIAPLFTYTANEVFSYLPLWMKEDKKDIFDIVFNNIPEIQFDIDFNFWKKVLSEFHVIFDKIKSNELIKETSELILEFSDPNDVLIDGISDWFGVSIVSTLSNRPSLAEFEFEGKSFRLVKSHCKKCDRCWKRSVDFDSPICKRCESVLYKKKFL